jgi:hypothetical protein
MFNKKEIAELSGIIHSTALMLGYQCGERADGANRLSGAKAYLRKLTWEWEKAEFAKGLAREVEYGKALLGGGEIMAPKKGKGKKC